jgi:hypothetical protein
VKERQSHEIFGAANNMRWSALIHGLTGRFESGFAKIFDDR